MEAGKTVGSEKLGIYGYFLLSRKKNLLAPMPKGHKAAQIYLYRVIPYSKVKKPSFY